MITWMQRHRKYLVITIWVSTIAFIGAGFVGWGQYSYGEKAAAVAKVGDVSISSKELQQTYSRLFQRYSKMFGGQFDQEQAKRLGLDKQALRQLINEALLLNLAADYRLEATDAEVAAILQSQPGFLQNGRFDKSLYLRVLKQNRMTSVEYEDQLRKDILIQKVLSLFTPKAEPIEKEAFTTALGIADKIAYKIIDESMVDVNLSDAALKRFWEAHKNDYLTPRKFDIEYVEQAPVDSGADEKALRAYYNAHKTSFVGPDGKLLAFDTAKSAVKAALDDKATNKAALKTYIAFKKGRLNDGTEVKKATVTENDDRFSAETLKAIAGASALQPYIKPKKEGSRYVIVKLVKVLQPEPMTFEQAKARVKKDYVKSASSDKMLQMAKQEIKTFTPDATTDYLKRDATEGIAGLSADEMRELLGAVFQSKRDRGMAGLKSHKMVLYHIVDQNITTPTQADGLDGAVVQTKTALLNRGLIEKLNRRYETKVFMEGFAQ